MTISSTTSKNQYTANGVNTAFTYTFKIYDEDDIRVLIGDVVKTLSDYSVAGVGNDNGGTVTFNIAPANLAIVTLKRNEPLLQDINFVEGDDFPASSANEGLDRSVIRDQYLQEQIGRAITFGESSMASGVTLPDPAADLFLAWNPAGTNLINTPGIVGPTGPTGPAGSSVYNGGTSTGTANAQVITCTPTLSSYSALTGGLLVFIPVATNTSGTVTINIDGLGTNTVRKHGAAGDVSLAVGDIYIGKPMMLTYNGTNLILQNPQTYSKGATLASAGTVNIGAATGDYVEISGTTTITALTLLEGQERTVKFQGILTLTNGANLICPGGANIITAANDLMVVRGEASSVVRIISYSRASGTALITSGSTGRILQTVESMLSTYDNTATAIPYDNTPPEITEGKEFTTVAFTPQSASSMLEIEVFGNFSHQSSNEVVIMGLFVNSTTNALAATVTNQVTSKMQSGYIKYRVASASTTLRTYRMRFGPATGTAYINGDSTAARLGGVMTSGIRVTEIL